MYLNGHIASYTDINMSSTQVSTLLSLLCPILQTVRKDKVEPNADKPTFNERLSGSSEVLTKALS